MRLQRFAQKQKNVLHNVSANVRLLKRSANVAAAISVLAASMASSYLALVGARQEVSAASSILPAKIVGGYWQSWQGPNVSEITANAPQYNLQYAAFALDADGNGGVSFNPAFQSGSALKADIAASKARGSIWLLSIGGGGHESIRLMNESHASNMFNSLVPIIDEYGFQGIDYDMECGSSCFSPAAAASLAAKLKAKYGSNFVISSAPRPYEMREGGIYTQLAKAIGDNLDLFGLQFYDFPQANDASQLASIISSDIASAVSQGIPASKILIGCITYSGYRNGSNTVETYKNIFQQQQQKHPDLRGVFIWDTSLDKKDGWPFAKQMGEMLGSTGQSPNPTPNPGSTPTLTPVTCTTPDAGFGQAKGSVSVDGTGTYYVWARIKPTATANAFKLDVEGIGGQCGITIGDSSSLTAGTWQWVNYAAAATGTPLKLDLATGAHNVTMTGTEDGLEVDKLLLTADASCTPQGTGGCAGGGPGTGGADSEAPKVTLSKPGAGEEIAGPYDAVYNASDDVGVVKTELLVDGVVHATDTTKASKLFLDISKLANGPHTVAVKAYDVSGKFGLSPAVNVTTRYGIGGDPNATPVDLTPAIKSLTASPATVTSGGTTKIKWSTANVADGNCSLTPSVLSAAQANGEWTTPALTASVNYTLVCVGTGSASVSKSVSVVVKSAQANTPVPVSSSPKANTPKSTSSNQSSKVTSATTGQTVTNGSAGGSVSGNTTLDPTNITDSLKPETITKVEYYDGTNLLQTDYTDPFALDTTQLKDGVYTITERTYYNDGSTSELTQTLDVKNVSSKTKDSSKKGVSIWVFLLPFFILAGGFALFLFIRRRNQDAAYDPYLAGVDTTQIDTAAYPPAVGYGDGTPDWQQGIAPNQPGSGEVIVPTDENRKDTF